LSSSAAAQDAVGASFPGEIEALLLCRSHFFFGRCEESHRRKSGCRYLHYSSRWPTLASALSVGAGRGNKAPRSASNELELSALQQDRVTLSEQAAGARVDAGDHTQALSEAMDMLYYTVVELRERVVEGSSDDSSPPQPSLSAELTDALAGGSVKLGSVVYVVVNNTLVFDRNREGVLLSDVEFLGAVSGDGSAWLPQRSPTGARRASVGSEDDDGDPIEAKLPGSVLERVLTFLPDASVASASRVCKAWHREIGRNSPDLWRHLLGRRGWPEPRCGGDIDARDACRAAFVQHYEAVRDLLALQRGLSAIASSKSNLEEKEMAYQTFSSRKGAPSQIASGECVSMQVWSPGSILAGYSRDCSIRLYEAVPRGGCSAGANGLLCREIVCRRIDPYRNTKRRTCVMLSMVVDEESIGCLCHVMADTVDAEAYILVVLSREDFLVGDNGSAKSPQENGLRVIDVGEAVLNYLLSSDVVDHRLLQLLDFLASTGGEIGAVEVLASRAMAACGHGRFMIEVSIAIPTIGPHGAVAGEDDSPMHLLDRKLVLFSLTADAIVWMGDSQGSLPLRPRHEDMTIASLLTLPFPRASRCACSVMVASSTTLDIMSVSIEPSFQIECSRLPDDHAAKLPNENWDHAPQSSRAMILVGSDAIAADVFRRTVNNRIVDRMSAVVFYPRFLISDGPPITDRLELEGDIEVERMASLTDKHIILLCRQYVSATGRPVPSHPDESDTEPQYHVCAVGILIHVGSRREIHRVTLLEGVDPERFQLPEVTSASHKTIGAGLSWRGVVMTGSSVRSASERHVLLPSSSPVATMSRSAKKKKKLVPKGSKKDGFARGMSLRG
jgi:hypothetical protein